ncbi:MAG: acetate/propionate family kinase [Vicinamibacterales bacterium]
MASRILTINTGSSSLRAGVFSCEPDTTSLATAHVERIGADATLHVGSQAGQAAQARTHREALDAVLARLGPFTTALDAIAHRVVHGGASLFAPTWLTPPVVREIATLVPLAPDHLPQALDAIEGAARVFPAVAQAACFDTAFHHSMPGVATMYPLPRRLREAGVRRFGFHGLSCESIMERLRRSDPSAAAGRVIIAHLGSGASMTAVQNGQSVETTMGFSPTGGIMMGTRCGDLDPGVLLHLLRNGTDVDGIARLVNHEAGLLGVSGVSADMRDLLAREPSDAHAAEAVALFCHLARKAIGSLMVVLGGLDTLVFTGGTGQHSSAIRTRLCTNLDAFGLVLDQTRNSQHAAVISRAGARVVVRVIETDEDLMLARHAHALLAERGPHV